MDSGVKRTVQKILLALCGAVALAGAAYLLFIAAFPYIYGESGSSRYAREHRIEGIAEVLGAVVLLTVAWKCFRRALSAQAMLASVALLVLVWTSRSLADYTRTPPHLRPAGGAWRVVAVPRPSAVDTVYYQLYYKRRVGYEKVHDMVGEFSFVAPDCMMFRGLKVVGRPKYAMCGYRSPVREDDTLTSDADVLQRARRRPRYSDDWQYAH